MKPKDMNLNETGLVWEHHSRILALEGSLKNIKDQSESISVIITKLDYIAKAMEEIKTFQREVEDRVTQSEKEMSSQRERTNNLALFQSGLSILIGAAVAFLKPK